MAVAALTVTLLTGCVGQQEFDITYYNLSAPATGKPAPAPKFGSIFVHDFYVNPSYEDKNFNYRTGDLTYETDFYNQFKLSPRMQFTALTREALKRSGLFQTILMPESSRVSDYSIAADVSQFYADFRNPQNPRAVLTVSYNLTRNLRKGLEHPLLFAKTYSESVPIAKKTADEVARAWDLAFGNITRQFLRDLARVTPPAAGETQ